MIRFLMALLLCAPAVVWADSLTVTRVLRPGEVVRGTDLTLLTGTQPGGVTRPDALIGQEARVVLYPGRPIRADDVRAPAVVQRNGLVDLVFVRAGLRIVAEGRALDRGAPGDRVPVLNTASRQRVTGRVTPDGQVEVD